LLDNEFILETNKKLDSFQATINYLKDIIEKLVDGQNKIEDWITEKEAVRITGLCRTTLLRLRKEGELTSSTLSGKQNFYRLSDIKKLLDLNETKR
jgi:hypothetical protein